MKEYIPSEQISDIEEFKEFVNHLCDSKLLSPSDVKKLMLKFSSSAEIKFPINFQQFEQIISTCSNMQ